MAYWKCKSIVVAKDLHFVAKHTEIEEKSRKIPLYLLFWNNQNRCVVFFMTYQNHKSKGLRKLRFGDKTYGNWRQIVENLIFYDFLCHIILYQQKSPKFKVATWKRHQNFDYSTIADRFRTVSLSNGSHPTGLVKPVYGIPTSPLIMEREKGRDLTKSYDKSPCTDKKIKKATWEHKNATKKLRLHNDCGPT